MNVDHRQHTQATLYSLCAAVHSSTAARTPAAKLVARQLQNVITLQEASTIMCTVEWLNGSHLQHTTHTHTHKMEEKQG